MISQSKLQKFACCLALWLILLASDGYSQEIANLSESPKFWTSMMARNVRNDNRDVELLQARAQATPEIARYLDLAERTKSFLENSLPQALEHYEALLRGEEGLLHGDKGRFLAQNGKFAETILRWVLETRLPLTGNPDPTALDHNRVDFGPQERAERLEVLTKAIAELKKNTGLTFNPDTTPSALVVMNNATWTSKAFDTIDSRIALLEGYIASVPDNVDVSRLPTLENEVKEMFARRISTFESRLNEVEKQAAEERSIRIAEATSQMRETELEDHLASLKELFEQQRQLDRMKAEKEIQSVSIEADRLKEQIETKYKRELAAAEERAELLRKELKLRELEVDKVTAEIQVLTKRLELAEIRRAMPINAKALVSILTSKGYWKPVHQTIYRDGNFDGDSKYPGTDPVPHSLTTLSTVGALDDNSQGLYKLYLILATGCDTMRPRFEKVFYIDERTKNYISNPAAIKFLKTEAIEREFTKSTEAREALEKLKTIQGILRDYGEELVRQGLLAH